MKKHYIRIAVVIEALLLVVFLSAGTDEIMTKAGITTSFFSQVVTGLMFLIIIGGEFFINYKIVFRRRAETSKTPTENALSPKEEQAPISEEASPASDEPSADAAKEENV